MNINDLPFEVLFYLFTKFLSERCGLLRCVHPVWTLILNQHRKTKLVVFVTTESLRSYAIQFNIVIKMKSLINNIEHVKLDPELFFEPPFDLFCPDFGVFYLLENDGEKGIRFMKMLLKMPGIFQFFTLKKSWFRILSAIFWGGDNTIFDWFCDQKELIDLCLRKHGAFPRVTNNKIRPFIRLDRVCRTLLKYPTIFKSAKDGAHIIFSYFTLRFYSSFARDHNQLHLFFDVKKILQGFRFCESFDKLLEFYSFLKQFCKFSSADVKHINGYFLFYSIQQGWLQGVSFFSNLERIFVPWKLTESLDIQYSLDFIRFVLTALNDDDDRFRFFKYVFYCTKCSTETTDFIFNSLQQTVWKPWHFFQVYCQFEKTLYLIDHDLEKFILRPTDLIKYQSHKTEFFPLLNEKCSNQQIKQECKFLFLNIFSGRREFDYDATTSLSVLFCVSLLIPFDVTKSFSLDSFQFMFHLLEIQRYSIVLITSENHLGSKSKNLEIMLDYLNLSPNFVRNKIKKHTPLLIQYCKNRFHQNDFNHLIPTFYQLSNLSMSSFYWMKANQIHPPCNSLEEIFIFFLRKSKLQNFIFEYQERILKETYRIPLKKFFIEWDVRDISFSFYHIQTMSISGMFDTRDLHTMCQFYGIE